MFEGGSEASGTGVAIEAEGPRRVMTASQSGKTSIGSAASSTGRARTVSSIAEVKSNAAPFFIQKGRYRANVVSHVGQERAVVTKTTK